MSGTESATFTSSVHIDYIPPAKVYTMADIGLSGSTGVTLVAVTEPFRLFSKEAVQMMRDEVLSTQVWDNCRFSSSRSLDQCQLRGMAPK
jgi:hypothetical protein